MAKPQFIWEAHEYVFQEKTSDWYWVVGIVSVSAAVLCFIFGNMLFGLIIFMGGFILSIFAARRPKLVRYELNKSGVLVDKRLYPYGTLESFWVEDNRHLEMESKLMFKSQRLVVPLIVIPLDGLDPEDVRDFLLDHLLEEHHEEPLSQKIMENLGF
jgi:hypothetical protein